ncbi:hypothetical protein O181_052124 [Austropuccinia psidii MF-1]|uniref:Uncharacterized protein n=1 Tax=Austropuccinia psidii MF-1 TaxID=1389203 RepID=A0A9Q3HRC9_9BASI|nr:hypothetical protein [Austropuccinia psidii MF-1]
MLHQYTLASTLIHYTLDSSIPLSSIIHHWKIIQPSSILILARYTFHKAINTASRIQYRSSASQKEEIPFFVLSSSIFGIFQARAQAVPIPTSRASFDGTPAVPQLREHLDRGLNLKGAAPFRKEGRGPRRSSSFSGLFGGFSGLSKTTFKGSGEDCEEEEENSVEEEESDGTEGVPEPYLSNLTNQDPEYLFNNWALFESRIFTLFGDPNEVRKAEAELYSLIMKEGGNVLLYIADFKSLVSSGYWG